MTSVQDGQKNSTAFNRAVAGFGDWLYQQRRGRHDHRRAEILARVAIFPGGEELLRQAAEMGVNIVVAARKEIGSDGYFYASDKSATIGIANTGNPAAMAMALWHELRHMRQHAANPGGMAFAGQLKDVRTGHMMSMMAEADAFTAETLMALQQKKAGNPEYHNALLDKSGPGAHQYIKRFLRQRPYESFANDASFARALFTGLMLDGLLSYRAEYFARLGHRFTAAEDLPSFREMLQGARKGGTAVDAGLAALYGEKFMSVSPRALATAFFQAQPVDEQEAIRLVEGTVSRADKLTESEFRAARNEILQRTGDIYQKDPDEYEFRGATAEKAAKKLMQAAAGDASSPDRKSPSTDRPSPRRPT